MRHLLKFARSHPRINLLAALILVLAATGAGVYIYARQHWRAAKADVAGARYDEAQQHLRKCLFFWPRDPAVHVLAARAHRLTGDFESAENHLNECLRIERGASSEVQLEFMLMRVQRGEVDEVAPILLRLVDEEHPDSALILETCAGVYMYNHRYRPALKCLDRWIALKPDAARAFQWRGWVYEYMNFRHDALEEYKKALELDPEPVTVRLRVAEMLLNEKQFLEALPLLEALRTQFPDRAVVKARLGQCRFLQGHTDEARQLLTDAVAELPDDSQLLLDLGRLELEAANGKEAEKWLRRAIDIDPGTTEPRFHLVASLELQGRKQDAAKELSKYLETKSLLEQANKMLREEVDTPSRDARTAHQIGAIMLQIGQSRLGLYWLHQALNRDQEYQPTHKLLAEYYESQKDERNAALHRARIRQPDRKTPGDSPASDKNEAGKSSG